MRQFLSNLNPNAPVPFWTLVGATSAGLVWVILSLSTQAVHADAQFTVPVGSAPVASAAAQPTPVNVSQSQQALLHGVASWYGPRFNGRTTASGEQFDMNAMTACHPNLPFGSVVRVTNLTNHKSVVVRINDRGYLYDHRILDLSYGAAKKLAMVEPGLARVRIDVLSLGHSKSKKINN